MTMRNMSEKKVEVGSVLYNVTRCSDDGKLHLWKTQVTDIIVTKTPTGRDRKPIIKAKAINYYHGKGDDDGEFNINPFDYYDSATNAVSASLRDYFDMKASRNMSSEDRLLNAIFGEKPNPRVAATELVDVIYDLKNYHALFSEAFAEDDKNVQSIEVEEKANEHGTIEVAAMANDLLSALAEAAGESEASNGN